MACARATHAAASTDAQHIRPCVAARIHTDVGRPRIKAGVVAGIRARVEARVRSLNATRPIAAITVDEVSVVAFLIAIDEELAGFPSGKEIPTYR